MTVGRYVIASFLLSLRAFLLSLRAEGVAISGKQNSKIKGQSEEGFYILICHFDFLCLIFNKGGRYLLPPR
jgi:hypothetical protein